jgi:hypothetical protein
VRSPAAVPNDDDESTTRRMTMDEAAEAIAAVAMRHSRAAKARRTAERRALPLLARLGTDARGTHAFSAVDFEALARYLSDGCPADAQAALTCGRLEVGALTLVRDKALVPEPAQPPAKRTEPRLQRPPGPHDEASWLKRRAEIATAENLLHGLPQTGTHYFAPVQFRTIVEYLLEGDPEEIAKAFKGDRIRLGKVTIACRRKPTDGTTISAFARERGIAQQTLHDRAMRARLRPMRRSGRLLFDRGELAGLVGATLPDSRG